MVLTLKKIGIRLALIVVKTAEIVRRGLEMVLGPLLIRPLAWLANGVFRFLLFPLYKRYRIVRQRLARNPLFAGLENFGHFVQRYAMYAAIAGIGVLVASNNIFARTIRPDEVGVGAAWTSFAHNEIQNDVIVEKTTAKSVKVNPTIAVGTESGSGTTANTNSDIISDPSALLTIGQDSPNMSSPAVAVTSGSYRTDTVTYTVISGDTASTIAHRFGLGTQTLLWANNMSANDYIKPGQVLKIPARDGVLIAVKSGDSVASLAKKYGGDVSAILEANQLASADAIQSGEELLIPGGEPPAPPVTSQPSNPSRSGSNNGSRGSVSNETPPPSTRSTGALFIWPTSGHRINQYFRGSYHTGVDIGGKYSSPLYAAASGTVVYAAYDASGYGLHIIIDHGNGYRTLYGHASKVFVHSGDRVKQGQTIGMLGSTGRSTGPHLHFEIRTAGGFLNPLSFF